MCALIDTLSWFISKIGVKIIQLVVMNFGSWFSFVWTRHSEHISLKLIIMNTKLVRKHSILHKASFHYNIYYHTITYRMFEFILNFSYSLQLLLLLAALHLQMQDKCSSWTMEVSESISIIIIRFVSLMPKLKFQGYSN